MSYSREQFDRIKAAAEERGYTVVSRWRPGLKNMRLGDIVLSESGPEDADFADEWDSADSSAYQDRVEAGLEPEG